MGQVVTMFARAVLLIHQVAPFILSKPLRLKWPRVRETVSREVPTNWAISSWVSVTRMGISPGLVLFSAKGCSDHARINLANFSGTELE